MLLLHSYLRWLVFFGIIYFLVLTLFMIFRKNHNSENFVKKFNKNFFLLMIIVDIQLIIGLILFVFYFKGVYSLDKSILFKTKDIRFFMIEHPLIMLMFTFLMHWINRKIKKYNHPNQLYTIAIYLLISFLFLLIGMPWFRPWIRFY